MRDAPRSGTRYDPWLVAVVVVGIVSLLTVAGAQAAMPPAGVLPTLPTGLLVSEASDDGGILGWIGQNAALETAWLVFIAASIARVAMEDPKRQ